MLKLNDTYFGSWKIDKRIGSGSYGSVYRLKKNDFGEDYYAAMKVIPIAADDCADDCIREVTSEISLMSRLKGNSHIVSFEDYEVVRHEEDGGCDILIRMEYLEPVLQYEKRHDFTEADALKLALDLCGALEVCEKHQILHRDIKPENILVSPDGDFKLGDFGIARTMEKNSFTRSKKGTYAYMAPEVYKGEKYNSTADIYSLGVVLYRFLNHGKLPFEETDKPTADQRENAVQRRLRGEELPPVGNDGLMKIIEKACAFRPEDRYRSAAEMKVDILRTIQKNEEQEPSDFLTRLGSNKAVMTALAVGVGAAAIAVLALIVLLII